MTRVALVTLVLAVSAAGCSAVAPPGALTREQATEFAADRVARSATPARAISAETGRLGDFDPDVGVHADRLVWAVTFEGEFEVCGGPLQAATRCQSHPTTRVYIDALTGEFVMAATPA